MQNLYWGSEFKYFLFLSKAVIFLQIGAQSVNLMKQFLALLSFQF